MKIRKVIGCFLFFFGMMWFPTNAAALDGRLVNLKVSPQADAVRTILVRFLSAHGLVFSGQPDVPVLEIVAGQHKDCRTDDYCVRVSYWISDIQLKMPGGIIRSLLPQKVDGEGSGVFRKAESSAEEELIQKLRAEKSFLDNLETIPKQAYYLLPPPRLTDEDRIYELAASIKRLMESREPDATILKRLAAIEARQIAGATRQRAFEARQVDIDKKIRALAEAAADVDGGAVSATRIDTILNDIKRLLRSLKQPYVPTGDCLKTQQDTAIGAILIRVPMASGQSLRYAGVTYGIYAQNQCLVTEAISIVPSRKHLEKMTVGQFFTSENFQNKTIDALGFDPRDNAIVIENCKANEILIAQGNSQHLGCNLFDGDHVLLLPMTQEAGAQGE